MFCGVFLLGWFGFGVFLLLDFGFLWCWGFICLRAFCLVFCLFVLRVWGFLFGFVFLLFVGFYVNKEITESQNCLGWKGP